MRIKTSRLILRPLQLSDEDNLLEYQSHPDVVAYIPWPDRTRREVREALVKTIALDNSKFEKVGDVINLGWELKSSGQVIGQSNLNLQSLNDKRAWCDMWLYAILKSEFNSHS